MHRRFHQTVITAVIRTVTNTCAITVINTFITADPGEEWRSLVDDRPDAVTTVTLSPSQVTENAVTSESVL